MPYTTIELAGSIHYDMLMSIRTQIHTRSQGHFLGLTYTIQIHAYNFNVPLYTVMEVTGNIKAAESVSFGNNCTWIFLF